jgi:hypothetical protein
VRALASARHDWPRPLLLFLPLSLPAARSKRQPGAGPGLAASQTQQVLVTATGPPLPRSWRQQLQWRQPAAVGSFLRRRWCMPLPAASQNTQYSPRALALLKARRQRHRQANDGSGRSSGGRRVAVASAAAAGPPPPQRASTRSNINFRAVISLLGKKRNCSCSTDLISYGLRRDPFWNDALGRKTHSDGFSLQ